MLAMNNQEMGLETIHEKRYYIDDIKRFESSPNILLQESILLILTNLEKELIANLPADVTSGVSENNFVGERRKYGNSGDSSSFKNEKPFFSKQRFNENNFERKRTGFSKNVSFSTFEGGVSGTKGRDMKGNPPDISLENSKWEKVKMTEPIDKIAFKPTEKIKPADDYDKKVKEVRIYLNKLSESNYESQSKLIFNAIETFFGEQPEDASFSQEIIDKFALTILTILSGNTFLSLVYSKLYKDLMTKFSIFEKILQTFIENFLFKIDEEVHYIDPDKDYDGYCKYVKNNDVRKATSLFIVNLVKIDGLDKIKIITILECFLSKSLEFINTENKVNEVEEMTDNIFVIISNIYSTIFETENWKNEIHPKIIQISQMKNKQHPSISSRIIFKYMDVQGFITKFSKKR